MLQHVSGQPRSNLLEYIYNAVREFLIDEVGAQDVGKDREDLGEVGVVGTEDVRVVAVVVKARKRKQKLVRESRVTSGRYFRMCAYGVCVYLSTKVHS